jgi:InsA N-terminal domain
MPTFIAVQCPHCHRDQVVKRGKTACGTQRYLCQNKACATGSFLLHYRNRGCLPEVGYRFKPGHSAASMTCREGLTTSSWQRQRVDL